MKHSDHDRRALIEAARLGSLLEGCTCVPDITITELAPGINTARIEHDDWCALLRRLEARNN